jgi:hypothetical protein
MAQYPHVASANDIRELNGTDAAFVVAKTSLGSTPSEVSVYWEDVENSEGDMIPTLMIYIEGKGVDVMITHHDELVYTYAYDWLAQR